VGALTARGYSEMIGAILLSVFACAGVFLMIGMAHAKGLYDVAIANVSGAITQQPFLVLPITMILMAIFAHTGVIDTLPNGGVLAIDFETTSVVIFGFPAFLILWKSVQDDGKVNWLETASMIAVFAVVIFFLAEHGAPADLGPGAAGS
jgi:Ca2+/Na+ antiporter